ncbi:MULTISPECIES: hypothetical protein [Aeromonas]|uniref:hypothetical protein n=1 Tax=Aeromonas TaxID=642 RepID=UPI001F24D3A0|nr:MULTISPECIES: hypothetical protein [Aeromonas]MCF5904931.1 hypothetical protein [Aeromonas veronii]
MAIVNVIISTTNIVANKIKAMLRERETNLKAHYAPYYLSVEEILSRHLIEISWRNKYISSFSSSSNDDDMRQQMIDIKEHNDFISEAASKSANGMTLNDMQIEILNLVTKLQGIVSPSLIESLNQYSEELRDAQYLGECDFLTDPCQNTLNLTRDLRAKIPTIHKDSDIE